MIKGNMYEKYEKKGQTEQSATSLPQLDEIDLSILRLLQEMPGITVKEISEQVHRVRRRFMNGSWLEQQGSIRQYAYDTG